MATNLHFGLSLEPDLKELESSWKEQEKKVQEILDKKKFNISVRAEGLDAIEDQLKRIQKLYEQTGAKQMSAYKAATVANQANVAAVKERVKWEAKAAVTEQQRLTEIEKTNAAHALAEQRQLRLAQAQDKAALSTQKQTIAYKNQTDILNKLQGFIGQYLGLLGAYRLVNNIKEITSEFELQRVSLQAITQDAQFAGELLSRIKATAVESPFSVKQMITYTKQLAAYRVENENLYDTMNMLADVSAGLGVDMNRLILAYGQVKAAAVLRGTELRQFTEAGIPMVEQLAVKFSQLRNEVVTTGDVFELISKRKVPFAMVAEIFQDMTEEGGKFYKMQQKQAESLYGVYENLKDNIQVSLDKIGRSNRGLFMGVGKALTSLAQNLDSVISSLEVLAASLVAYKIAAATASVATKGLATTEALTVAANAAMSVSETHKSAAVSAAVFVLNEAIVSHNTYAICMAKAALANNALARSFWKISASLVANPITAAVVGITAAVTGGVLAWKKYLSNLSSVDKAQEDIAKSMEQVRENHSQLKKKVDDLIKPVKEYNNLLKSQKTSYEDFQKIYPELAAKYDTELKYKEAIANANDNLKKAIETLKSSYPEYFGYLEEENFKISDLTKGYLNLANAERTALREKLQMEKVELEKRKQNIQEDIQMYQSPEMQMGDNAIGSAMQVRRLSAELEGVNARLESVNANLQSIGDAEKVASENALYWRQLYQENIDENIQAEELAQLKLTDAIDKTKKAYKDSKEELDQYNASIKQMRADINKPDADKEALTKNIKAFEEARDEVKKEIEGQKAFAKALNFSIDTKKETKAAKDALTEEYNLVETIYKRFTDLKQSMGDAGAAKKVRDIYSKSMANIDFLSPEGLKKRLTELQKRAESSGNKELAIKIGLKIQDVDFTQLKNELKKKLDALAKSITQQQTGINFFEKLLGITGDTELSTKLTVAVTGVDVTGTDVKSKLQEQIAQIVSNQAIAPEVEAKLQISKSAEENEAAYMERIKQMVANGRVSVQQLNELIASLKDSDLQGTLESALKSYVDYNTGMLTDFLQTVSKVGNADVQKNILGAQKNQKEASVAQLLKPENVDPQQWAGWVKAYMNAIQNEYNAGVAKIDFDTLKTKFSDAITNLDAASVDVLTQIIEQLKVLAATPGIDANTLKSINELVTRASNVKINKRPLQAFKEGWQEVANAAKKATKEEQDAGKASGLNKMKKSIEAMKGQWGQVESVMNDVISLTNQIADVFGVTFDEGTQDAMEGFATGLAVVTTALSIMAAAATVAETVMWPLLVIALAVGAAFAAIKWLSGIKERKANKEIERLEKSMRSLERAYTDIEKAQEKAVGSEWIKSQNDKIENLKKQIANLQEQMYWEESKGKKTDESVVEDLKDEIYDAQNEIKDLQDEITKEMTGTDLTSAAVEFAEAWLDAYLEFADTTDAIKEKFLDMMKSMVTNSVLAKVVQRKLQPLFDYIDKSLYDEDGNMIGSLEKVWTMMKKVTEELPTELEAVYNSLGTWAQELRTSDSQLTGISKGISTASEESVVTLAGYANSILFHHVKEAGDIEAIRAILEGKMAIATDVSKDASGVNIGQLVELQQQTLAQVIAIKEDTTNIRSDIRDLRDSFHAVLATGSGNSPKTINVKLRS